MINVKKKSILYLLLFILLLFIFSVSIVIVFKSGDKKSNVKEDDVYIEATSLNVTLKDYLAVSNDFGKTIKDSNGGAFAYIDIEIINDVDQERNYQLFVTKNTDDSDISPEYIKLYLTDMKDEAMPNFDRTNIPSFASLHYINDKPSSKLILSGTIGPKKHINVKLRSWINDSYVISEGNKSFSYDLGIRAVK